VEKKGGGCARKGGGVAMRQLTADRPFAGRASLRGRSLYAIVRQHCSCYE